MLNEHNTVVKRVKGIETQCRAFVDNSQSGQTLRGNYQYLRFLATIDKGQAFNNPGEFAVWLGLTPKQWAKKSGLKWRETNSLLF